MDFGYNPLFIILKFWVAFVEVSGIKCVAAGSNWCSSLRKSNARTSYEFAFYKHKSCKMLNRH